MLHLQRWPDDLDYPTSDGKPMAETDQHRDQMVELIQTLSAHFSDREDVYVSGNLLWFYREGDKRRHISPDTLVRFGSARGPRLHYLQWREGGPPQVVFELTSKTTRKEDLGRKFTLYEELGVEEYYLFDPLRHYLKPRFRGFHRHGGQLLPVAGEPIRSPRLGLELWVREERLRLRHPDGGAWLQTDAERARAESARAEAERSRAESEHSRAEAAQSRAEAAQSRAEAAQGRAEAAQGRAESERSRAESERSRAEAERARAEAAEAELRALKARLAGEA